jgi:hypothetical protein
VREDSSESDTIRHCRAANAAENDLSDHSSLYVSCLRAIAQEHLWLGCTGLAEQASNPPYGHNADTRKPYGPRIRFLRALPVRILIRDIDETQFDITV